MLCHIELDGITVDHTSRNMEPEIIQENLRLIVRNTVDYIHGITSFQAQMPIAIQSASLRVPYDPPTVAYAPEVVLLCTLIAPAVPVQLALAVE